MIGRASHDDEEIGAGELLPDAAPAIDLCTAFARALHEHGVSAMRLERRLARLSDVLGVPAEFFVTPTAILASYRIPGSGLSRSQLARAEPGAVDLGKLADIESLLDDLLAARVGPEEARNRLRQATAALPVYGVALMTAAAGLVSAAAAVLLGGGVAEALIAAAVGSLIGGLEVVGRRRGAARRLVAPAVATIAAMLACLAARVLPGFSVVTAQVASLIVLVPGLEFTLAIKDVATANLVSGAARMISALGDFLALAFGVVTGTQLVVAMAGAPVYTRPVPLPGVAMTLALVIAAAGFVIRLRAHTRDAPAILLVSIVGFAGTWAGGAALGSDLGPFIGALLVGLGANAHARWWQRSPMIVMVPSIILLVPGAVGFRSFALLMREDVLGGVQTAYGMAMVGTALSTGLLLANLILTPEPARAPSRETRRVQSSNRR